MSTVDDLPRFKGPAPAWFEDALCADEVCRHHLRRWVTRGTVESSGDRYRLTPRALR